MNECIALVKLLTTIQKYKDEVFCLMKLDH